MIKVPSIIFVFLLGWGSASAQKDSLQNSQLWDCYCALFDSTQPLVSFQQNLFHFNRQIESKIPIDTAELAWNLGESIQIIFKDSLQFHCNSNWSWSGSWRHSSNEVYLKGKPIYERTYPDFAALKDTSVYFQSESESLPDVFEASKELYNFWAGTKLTYTYQYVPMEEATYIYDRYPSKIVLHGGQKILKVLHVAYEPIDPNHRLKWYFENDLLYRD